MGKTQAASQRGAAESAPRHLEAAETDRVEHVIQRDAEPPVAVEEQQKSQRDENDAADSLDDDVVVTHPTEDGHRPRERDAREQERDAEPRGIRDKEQRP